MITEVQFGRDDNGKPWCLPKGLETLATFDCATVFRLKAPGGWLLFYRESPPGKEAGKIPYSGPLSGSICFVPDPNHRWKIKRVEWKPPPKKQQPASPSKPEQKTTEEGEWAEEEIKDLLGRLPRPPPKRPRPALG